MADKFHETGFTDSVRKAQAHRYGKLQSVGAGPELTNIKTRGVTLKNC